MTSTTPRIIATALAILALAVPAASAMPIRAHGVQTSSLAGTYSAPTQDLRNPDNQAPGVKPDARIPAQQPQTMRPVHLTPQAQPAAAPHHDAPSPLVFILPSLALMGALAATTLYLRSSRQPARA
jgi:hypothetical protein